MQRLIPLASALVLVTGCPEDPVTDTSDIGPDMGLEAGVEAGPDMGVEAGPDMGVPDIGPDMGGPELGDDPTGDLTCTGSPKLDITSVECGGISGEEITITIRMADAVAPTSGLFYSWFVRCTVSDDMGTIGVATVQEHDGVYDELFEGALDASNTSWAITDAFEITFDEPIVPPGNYIVLEAGVLETAGGTVCTERAPDMGTFTVCEPSASP